MQQLPRMMALTTGVVAVALLLMVPSGRTAAQDAAYEKFLGALSAGADCPRLFELRNAAKRTATPNQEDQMNVKPRGVGCCSSTSTRTPEVRPNTGDFTVKEYRIYRAVIDTPMSVAEEQAMRTIGAAHNMSVAEVRKTTRKVEMALFKNKWYGTPETEIRHASDWKGEKR